MHPSDLWVYLRVEETLVIALPLVFSRELLL